MFACGPCFQAEGDDTYRLHPNLREYQKSCGANIDVLADSASKIDAWFSGFRDLFMLAYFVGMMNGVQISQLKVAAAGLEISLTVLTFVRLGGGIEKIATCKITKRDDVGNSIIWEQRSSLAVAADVMLVLMRLGLCVFALETVGVMQLGNMGSWLGVGVLVSGVAGTALFFFDSIHDLALDAKDEEEKCAKRKSFASNFLHVVCIASDTGIVMPGPYPLGIAITAISAVSNFFDAVNDCVAQHPATKLIEDDS